MRLGQNPAKNVKEVAKPERITVALVNYIPFISGYYAQGLDVLKLCLGSLYENSDLPHDLMVFDNGSCAEVQDYLVAERRAGRIQYLILSEKNLGKGGAWNVIFGGAPGEIIAYTDSDVLFAPGWLSRSVQVLETYPNVGMVTSRPFRTQENLSSATIEWAQRTPETDYQVGQFLSWEDFSSFVMSLGTSEEQTREWYASGGDMRVNYRGVPAQIGASHWQFLAYKTVLQTMLPFDMSRPMGQVRMLDQRINEMGMLRLMTAEPLAQNMSNQAPERAKARAQQKAQSNNPMKRRLLDSRPVKAALLRIYDRIFDAYYR